jgi:hypothetical protein
MIRKPTCQLLFFLALISYSCQAQVQQNPCDPQPPCLPALSQNFGFCLIWQFPHSKVTGTEAEGDLPFRILAYEDSENPANNTISISRLSGKDRFQVQFLNPERLHRHEPDSFQAIADTGNGNLQTLTITVKEEIIDCCPQFVVEEVFFNSKKVKRSERKRCFVFPTIN